MRVDWSRGGERGGESGEKGSESGEREREDVSGSARVWEWGESLERDGKRERGGGLGRERGE